MDTREFKSGQRIKIKSGKRKGQTGKIDGWGHPVGQLGKIDWYVEFPDGVQERYKANQLIKL